MTQKVVCYPRPTIVSGEDKQGRDEPAQAAAAFNALLAEWNAEGWRFVAYVPVPATVRKGCMAALFWSGEEHVEYTMVLLERIDA